MRTQGYEKVKLKTIRGKIILNAVKREK